MKCISKYDFIFIFFILVIINLIFYKICRPSFCSSFYLFIYFIFFGALFSYQPEKVGDILEEGREGGGGQLLQVLRVACMDAWPQTPPPCHGGG